MKNDPQTEARTLIDELLRQAGWDPADKSQVRTEATVSDIPESLREIPPPGSYPAAQPDGIYRDDLEERPGDYVLLDRSGRPLAIVEARRGGIDPCISKQQTLPMARRIGAPFIFLLNGDLICLWDYANDDARSVSTFYSRRDLERIVSLRKESKPLAAIPIPDYYLRLGERRSVRPYQKECMKALDKALDLGRRRFLIELPTGMGKTDLIALYLERLFQAGRVQRALFLVDRKQLAAQAIGVIQDILSHYSAYFLKAGMERQEQQITVCLLQTMLSHYPEFTSAYFDVVIADECHRSIYGPWPAALTHFDAIHIGLTAVPAACIERNTFRFYQCKSREPDFAFPIAQAVEQEFLAPYNFATGITCPITEETGIDGKNYDPAEFERKWTNEDTNRKMMAEFDRLAWENYRELAPGQKVGSGKAIVFAITKHHAARLAQYLNELHPEHEGRYAEVITPDVPDAARVIRNFNNETYPMIAVSVDMLTAGFDCREVIHVVLCRRVFSPILYQQMRGRGARTAPHIQKKKFVIYDFFRNHEYFNDSEPCNFGGQGASGSSAGTHERSPGPHGGLVELGLADEWLEAVSYVEIGPAGKRLDKKVYLVDWEQRVRSAVDGDPLLRKVRESQPLSSEEEDTLERQLNRPEHYFNEDNLRRTYRRPGGTLIDFIRATLGALKLKSREDELNEDFQAWLVSRNLAPQQAQYLALLKNCGIVRGRIELADLLAPPLSILNAASLGVDLFGEQGLREIISDLNESVFARTSAQPGMNQENRGQPDVRHS